MYVFVCSSMRASMTACDIKCVWVCVCDRERERESEEAGSRNRFISCFSIQDFFLLLFFADLIIPSWGHRPPCYSFDDGSF